ncbi:hypothetical protein LTR35_008789 [Friedmanniomyces endolithicus]|uniref:Uncharacterized protein n=1 Tax=Friedmanniomyces endolithicus TaxID=329885 RepID=A0AAN6J2X7_9PEZI|nr:hypothetical protein LTR35_008789 [Friedmanniomyces endolithicus]KAK0295028.1 hypothetical protein LTS00_006494 [Friedmanniomyces endolithicus]KAK0310159.1 hypothetical protein LTR82_014982 [Friedmanniomyces endolithicus]KAK0990680.1 hypothetical protein LTR54_012040 [Friedmanniomyces endolithicus]
MTHLYSVFACGHITDEEVPSFGEQYVLTFTEATCGETPHCKSRDPAWYANKLRTMTLTKYDGPEALDTQINTLLANTKQVLADFNAIGSSFTFDEIDRAATPGVVAWPLQTAKSSQRAILHFVLDLPFINDLRIHIRHFARRPSHLMFLIVARSLAERAVISAETRVQGLRETVERLRRIALLGTTYPLSSRTLTDYDAELCVAEMAALRISGPEGEEMLRRPLAPSSLADAEALHDQVVDSAAPVAFRRRTPASSSLVKPRDVLAEVNTILAMCQYEYVRDFKVRQELRAAGGRGLKRPASDGLRVSTDRGTKRVRVQPVRGVRA